MKEMKGWSWGAYALSLGILIMGVSVGVHAAAVSCGEAIDALIPCTSFLLGSAEAASPSGECCDGARNLNNMASTSEARRALCNYFIESAPSFGVNPGRVKLLPKLCHLNFAIPDIKVNCSRIQQDMGIL